MRLKRKKLCAYVGAVTLAYMVYATCLPIYLDTATLARYLPIGTSF
jgi:hypothetical protein